MATAASAGSTNGSTSLYHLIRCLLIIVAVPRRLLRLSMAVTRPAQAAVFLSSAYQLATHRRAAQPLLPVVSSDKLQRLVQPTSQRPTRVVYKATLGQAVLMVQRA